jgi:hypothetical protein
MAALNRPLHLPTLASGRHCPVAAPPHELSSVFGPGVGDGPVYAVFGGTLTFEYPPRAKSQFAGSAWGGQKVLWVGNPVYSGPVLIRGHQLDGPNEVRFEDGVVPSLQLLFEPSDGIANSFSGFREWPSYTRLRASGCYAWQVDGTNFSEVIVFQARATVPVG